jgi:hypothetical protein
MGWLGWVALAQTLLPPRLSVPLGGRLHALAVSRDGNLIAAGGESPDGSGRLAVWETQTGRQVQTAAVWPAAVFAAVFSPDGNLLATGSRDGFIRLWDRTADTVRGWRATEGQVLALAFSRDGRWLASGGSSQRVHIWDVASGAQVHNLAGHTGAVFSLAFHPGGSVLASGATDGTVILWNLADGSSESRWSLHRDTVSALAFHPNGELLASGGWDGQVLLTETGAGASVVLGEEPALVFALAFSAQGEKLAAGLSEASRSGTLHLWHVATRTRVLAFDTQANRAVAFLPDGVSFTAGSLTGQVRIWGLYPQLPEPLVGNGVRAREFRWKDASALYYEVQVSRAFPFEEGDFVHFTRATSWAPAGLFVEGDALWWRVRAHGFANASRWSETRSLRWSGGATRAPTVRIEVSPERVAVGDGLTIQVVVENVDDLAGFELALLASPANLKVLHIQEGSALRADGRETFWKGPAVTEENDAVRVSDVAGARLGPGGISVSGTLVLLTARATKAGEVSLRLPVLRLSNSHQQALTVDLVEQAITVRPNLLPADVNRDGRVDVFDLVAVAQQFGRRLAGALSTADVNGDGVVDIEDLLLVGRDYGESVESAAAAGPRRVRGLTGSEYEALGAARRSLAEVAAVRPDAVRLARLLDRFLSGAAVEPQSSAAPSVALRVDLGQNYPNPFNPETWLPFRLNREAFVSIAILNAVGQTVRTLDIGRRAAGAYGRPAQAARWDGRNEKGEPCASGVYIAVVHAQTDRASASATRRILLIR